MSALAKMIGAVPAKHVWSTRPLGKVVTFLGGGTPSKQCNEFWGGDIPWISPKDMKFDVVTESIDKITSAAVDGSAVKLIPTGALLVVVRSGILARTIPTALTGTTLTINQDLKALVPAVELDVHFLAHFMRSAERKLLASVSRGATVHRLATDALKSLAIPLPPLEEQKRIVALLDRAFAAFAAFDRARANAEANLAGAAELFEATKRTILDAVSNGGSRVSLADVSAIESSLVDPRGTKYVDLPHIGAGNMCTGSGELIGVMTARQEKLKSGKYLFNESDVLYSKIRPYLRKVARPDFSGLCSADVYPLSPSEALDRDFLFHMLLGAKFTEYAESGSARAGMPKVNREHLFRYEFGLPPLEKQRYAAAGIDAVLEKSNELRRIFECKLADLAALRQSLLQKAFAGELT